MVNRFFRLSIRLPQASDRGTVAPSCSGTENDTSRRSKKRCGTTPTGVIATDWTWWRCASPSRPHTFLWRPTRWAPVLLPMF